MLSPGPWTGDCGVTDVDGSGCWSIQGAGVLLSTALSSNKVKFIIVLDWLNQLFSSSARK